VVKCNAEQADFRLPTTLHPLSTANSILMSQLQNSLGARAKRTRGEIEHNILQLCVRSGVQRDGEGVSF
jgi:hypothetical protein